MKKVLRFSLMLLATLFASVNIMAQTDVTSQYINNAGFDVESDWVAEGNVAINPASPGTVTEWTSASSDAWSGSAVLKIGSTASINNATVPALNAAGVAEGGAFACAASWMKKAQYTQDVTLPAGTYVLSFDAYEGNASVQAGGIDKYLIGFIADDGTEYLAKKETYTVGEWTSHEIKFILLEETTGKMSVGYLSANVTSANTPKIFIDNLKLTQSEIEYPVDLTGKAINRHNGWTKLASVGAINNFQTDYAEFYNAQHVTGDLMQQVVNVPNGKYNVEVRFNANCANWECTPVEAAEGQTGYTVMDINGTTVNTPVRNSKSLTSDQPYVYTINDLLVEDGNITFKVTNLQEAANWITVSISKIELQKPDEPVVMITETSLIVDGDLVALDAENETSVGEATGVSVQLNSEVNVVEATFAVRNMALFDETWCAVDTIAAGEMSINGTAFAEFDEPIQFNKDSKYLVSITAKDSEGNESTETYIIAGTYEEPAGWDGETVTTSMDNGVVTKLADLDGMTITLPGAKSIEMLDAEEIAYLSLQNQDGSEIYGIWGPTYGGTCSIDGETITLSGFVTLEEVTTDIPATATTLYIEDYGTFIVDGVQDVRYIPTIELTANITAPAEPFEYTVTNDGVEGDATKAVEASENGVMYQFELKAEGKALSKGEGVPTLTLLEDATVDFGAANLIAYEAETAYIRFMTLQQPYFTQPGTYVLTIPEGTFVDAEGTPNAEATYQWVIIGSEPFAGLVPVPAAEDGETIQYLLNIETGAFFTEGNDWGTRASIAPEKGNPVKMQKLADGKWRINNRVEKFGDWRAVFADNGSSIWVDNVNGANVNAWELIAQEDGTYKIANTAAAAGVLGFDYYSGNTRLFLSEDEKYASTWAFISAENYEEYLQTEEYKVAVANFYNTPAIPAVEELVANNNIVDPSFVAQYEEILAAYYAGTLTEVVANPNAVTGWHGGANNLYAKYIISAWDVKVPDAWDTYHVNTWSTEGSNDGSNFTVPFIEYWTGDDASLAAKTMTAVQEGLEPGQEYEVSAWVRVRVKNGSSDPYGISFQTNDDEAIDVCVGEQIGETPFYIMTVSTTAVADAEGKLTVKFNVDEDNSVSWLAFKNVKYTKPAVEIGEPTFNVAAAQEEGVRITTGYIEANGIVMTLAEAENITPNMQIKVVADLWHAVPTYGAEPGTAPSFQPLIEGAEFTGDAMFGLPTVAMTDFAQAAIEAGEGNIFQILIKSIEVLDATGVVASYTHDPEAEPMGCAFAIEPWMEIEATAAVSATAPNQYGDEFYQVTVTIENSDNEIAAAGVAKAYTEGVLFSMYDEEHDSLITFTFACDQIEGVEVAEEEDVVLTCTDVIPAITADQEFEGEFRAEGTYQASCDVVLVDADEKELGVAKFAGELILTKSITGINQVAAKFVVKDVIYTIGGVRVNAPVKGINIINGKKVIK